jgi:hypothetical protein
MHAITRLLMTLIADLTHPGRPAAYGRARVPAAAGIAGLIVTGLLTAAPVAASAAQARSLMPSPNAPARQDSLAGVACPAARRCVAVGQSVSKAGASAALVKSWNGRTWSVQRAPRSGGLTAVSCTSARACTAVGYRPGFNGIGTPLAERWNGRKWASQSIHGKGDLTGVACPAAKMCIAVGGSDTDLGSGSYGLVKRWNGRKWAGQRLPAPSYGQVVLNGVSCTSARACIAVGYGFDLDEVAVPLAFRWNGRSWARQDIPVPSGQKFAINVMTSASCSAVRACTAVGYSDNEANNTVSFIAERWNGARWTVQSIPDPAGGDFYYLNSVWCPAARACIAVGNSSDQHGDNDAPLAETWNGTAWVIQATVRLAGDGSLGGVSCTTALACTAVGSTYVRGNQVTLAERWNGTTWAVQPTPGNPAGTPRDR